MARGKEKPKNFIYSNELSLYICFNCAVKVLHNVSARPGGSTTFEYPNSSPERCENCDGPLEDKVKASGNDDVTLENYLS